jgi:signal transduction histidine kinase
MMEIAALILGTVATLLVALMVTVKDKESITSRLFTALAISLVGWSLTTYFSLHTLSDQQTLFWVRWVMFFVVVQNTSFFLLVQVFPYRESSIFKRKRYIAAFIYSAITAAAALSPFLFVDVINNTLHPGPAMPLFMLHALIFAAGGIVLLFIRFHRARGREKAQLRYFLAGTVVLFTLVPLANFVLPLAFDNNSFVVLTPLYVLTFATIIAYAIVAKRLFDVRLAVARGVAYVLSLGCIGLLYGAVIVALSSLDAFNQQSTRLQQVEYVAFALVTALMYPPAKRFFAKVTNRILYQDAYDPQLLMNKLNRSLVVTTEVDELLFRSLTIIEQFLKPEYSVAMLQSRGKDPRIVTTTKKQVGGDELAAIGSKVKSLHGSVQVVVVDDLRFDESKLRDLLTENDIALFVNMGSDINDGDKMAGYLAFGPKKSGNPYNKHDIAVMETITNELVIAIQNALRFEEITRFNRTLQANIEDATKKLRRKNERLRVLDQTKDDFISMASHQLRTPLTSVKGYVSMVLEGDAGKVTPLQRKLLNQSFVSAQRMVYLISDLLNVSRLRTGKFELETVPTNLATVIASEVEQLKETAQARNLELTYTKPEHFPVYMLDETKLRQVIMNFIDNAIYYTPSGGHIEVRLSEKPHGIELTVTDDGIGVPKRDQPQMFTKYFRARNAQVARPDGTGLGLFMAKKVILAHGGAIIFKSRENKGSTFGFSMPQSALKSPPTAAKLSTTAAKHTSDKKA